jgi:hypothetical protein
MDEAGLADLEDQISAQILRVRKKASEFESSVTELKQAMENLRAEHRAFTKRFHRKSHPIPPEVLEKIHQHESAYRLFVTEVIPRDVYERLQLPVQSLIPLFRAEEIIEETLPWQMVWSSKKSASLQESDPGLASFAFEQMRLRVIQTELLGGSNFADPSEFISIKSRFERFDSEIVSGKKTLEETVASEGYRQLEHDLDSCQFAQKGHRPKLQVESVIDSLRELERIEENLNERLDALDFGLSLTSEYCVREFASCNAALSETRSFELR